ncbi:hypothetical protein Bsp3421_003069 [Burkholderia sp. FERM BP-3421]|jgi:hypothetical protein|uniref:hypothetical protein n=1 Tax=Burkholderia sp. FERM BP-3421 TaxID=1494466 RepID=UPI00235F0E3D|nr:hypothetical protein [Burkholderia sp. FERM BP-3421]WDD93024.1 hypothetical protein Bsp3421_003069 [Burkholderia sp. FERM BP-3421]
MNIRIDRPFFLNLDVIETDDYVPSMKMEISVELQQFGSRIDYRGALWFNCSSWDEFVLGLNNIDTADAVFFDMSGYFVLRIRTVSGKPEISWEVKRSDIEGATATVAFRSPIDEDILAHVKRQVEQFPVWW